MAIRIGTIVANALMLGTTPIQRVFLGTVQIWANEVVVVLGNRTNVVLKSLFTSAQWSDAYLRKRVVAPEEVEIGGTAVAFALRILPAGEGQADSWAGDLTLDIRGRVSGAGGAPNSGVGGHAIDANSRGRAGQRLRVNLFPSGTLRSGAGGGGRGGTGGNGQFPFTFREPSSGFRYQPNSPVYAWNIYQDGDREVIRWNGTTLYDGPSTSMPTTIGGWRYLRGPARTTGNIIQYEIARQQTRQQATTGGPGGAGARGAGFDGARGTGAAGEPGSDAGAGAGGRGGDGGDFGQPGQAGARGSNGNVSNGLDGATGGLPGGYINGAANVDFNNSGGTVIGRLI